MMALSKKFPEGLNKYMSNLFRKFIYFFIIVLILFYIIGCKKDAKQVSEKVKKYSTSQGVSEQIFEENENTVTLTHDFGVLVQPIEKEVTCEFEIKNETQTTWNLKSVVDTCSCVITEMTSPKVEEGKTAKLLVVYKPVGDGSFDDNRKSMVQFKEKSAPKFILHVQSRVREPITIKPKSLSWNKVGENQTRKDNFEIHNFSGKKFDKFEIAKKPEWLSVNYKSIQTPQSEPSMKQLWFADVNVDTKGLSSGEHRGEIVLKFDNETKSLPVVLQITSAVSAIPAQFFFGSITKNKAATKSIKIIFSPDSIPKDKNEIKFEHDFGDQLQLAWLTAEGEFWELQATLKLSNDKLPTESVLTIVFSNPTLPKIKLPVYVMLEETQP
jgi:hypothetical protein